MTAGRSLCCRPHFTETAFRSLFSFRPMGTRMTFAGRNRVREVPAWGPPSFEICVFHNVEQSFDSFAPKRQARNVPHQAAHGVGTGNRHEVPPDWRNPCPIRGSSEVPAGAKRGRDMR